MRCVKMCSEIALVVPFLMGISVALADSALTFLIMFARLALEQDQEQITGHRQTLICIHAAYVALLLVKHRSIS